jgi:hypothetical protein
MSSFKSKIRYLRHTYIKFKLFAKNKLVRINKYPIFVLGNQKSGTTAIGALLAEAAGLTFTWDLKREIKFPTYHRIRNGELTFRDFIKRNQFDFSRQVIKEPQLTLFYKELCEHFPNARFVSIIRDPRDNIRSILNRLKIPGNIKYIETDQYNKVSTAWRLVLEGVWFDIDSDNYIETLAYRWEYIAELFFSEKKAMVLIRYEDFVKDKIKAIKQILEYLNLEYIHDISERIDYQFQPRGDREISWIDFFGEENLSKIEGICKNSMAKFGYLVSNES